MARPEDIDADITLEFGSDGIPPEKFKKGIKAFLGLVQSLTQTVCGEEKPRFQWLVHVKEGSSLVGVQASGPAMAKNLPIVQNSLVEVIQGCEPGKFPQCPQKYLKNMVQLSELVPQNSKSDMAIWCAKQRCEISSSIRDLFPQTLEEFKELGTVEGFLSRLEDHNGISIVIYDSVWRIPVKCKVSEEKTEIVRKLWGARVAAHGWVSYKSDGKPSRIEVNEIEKMPPENELPTYAELRGILRGYS